MADINKTTNENIDTNITENGKNSNLVHLILNIVKIAVLVIACLVVIVVIGANIYFKVPVMDYYKVSSKAFVIPDLNKGFIPQGLDYDDRCEQFFITGYYKEQSSPIYRVDKSGKLVGKVILNNADGSEFICHAGGIAVHDNYVYIAGGFDNCLYVFDYNDVMNASMNDSVDCIGMFSLEGEGDYLGSATMTVDDEAIYIAEFYREENYPTNETHHMVTTSGAENKAVMLKFEYSDAEDSSYGLSRIPTAAYSIPELCQGVSIVDGVAYLSSSYGVAKSHITGFELQKSTTDKTINMLGSEVPLYELDESSLVSTIELAPMSEEIEVVDGRMYVMCESASNKYIFGKLTGGEYCYAINMAHLK